MALAELVLTSRLSQEAQLDQNFVQELNAERLLSTSKRMHHAKIVPRINGSSGPIKPRMDVSRPNATTSRKLEKLYQVLTDCWRVWTCCQEIWITWSLKKTCSTTPVSRGTSTETKRPSLISLLIHQTLATAAKPPNPRRALINQIPYRHLSLSQVQDRRTWMLVQKVLQLHCRSVLPNSNQQTKGLLNQASQRVSFRRQVL